MEEKTYTLGGQEAPASQIGATLEALAAIISERASAGESSYTYRLLSDEAMLLGKVAEEAGEVVQAAREHTESGASADADHLRYEAGDVLYHLLVLLERHGISTDELAAELNMRMTEAERPSGGVLLHDTFVNRGK